MNLRSRKQFVQNSALLAFVFCSLFAVATTRAKDWPTFRGDAALRGISSEQLPEKFSLLWSFKTGAAVKSSPIVAKGKVFIGSDDTNVYALNFADGKKVWSFATSNAVEAPALFLNDKIYVGGIDGFLYALDAESGKLAWKYKTDDKIVGAPNVIPGKPTQVLVGSYDYKLHCLDAATGKSNWVYESGYYINGSPAVSDGITTFGGCDALLHVISLKDGKQIKEIEINANIGASVALADNRAYFGHYGNEFLCVDIAKTNVAWRYKNRDFAYFSSAAVTDDKVVFGGRDKLLHCVKRDDGTELWRFATRGKVDSSPVVAGDKAVVGSDDGRVYVVSLKDGQEIWSYEIGAPIGSSPAVADGKIVIGSDDGGVYCFGGAK